MSSRYPDIFPSFYERTPEGIKQWDAFSKMFESRIIMVVGPIDGVRSAAVIAQMVVLSQEDSSEPISLYIDSPGGDYESAIAIYNTMKFIPNPIITTCLGEARGVSALILAGGDTRMALEDARITLYTIEEPGERGQTSDILIRAELLEDKFNVYTSILASEIDYGVDELRKAIERPMHFTAQEAKDKVIIDIIAPSKKKPRFPDKKVNS